jgi:hypothetical protein
MPQISALRALHQQAILLHHMDPFLIYHPLKKEYVSFMDVKATDSLIEFMRTK